MLDCDVFLRRIDLKLRQARGVYFFQDGNGYIKIGVAEDIERRRQTYLPHSALGVACVGYIPTERLKENECFQHGVWKFAQVYREWYAPVRSLQVYLMYFQNHKGASLEDFSVRGKTPTGLEELLIMQEEIGNQMIFNNQTFRQEYRRSFEDMLPSNHGVVPPSR